MDEVLHQVYALPDSQGRITAIQSEAFLSDLTDWVQIDEGSGDTYLLSQEYYYPDGITDSYGRYLYRLEGNTAVARTQAELDEEGIPTPRAIDNGYGLPTGGAAGQVLEKFTESDYHAGWSWLPDVGNPSMLPNWDRLRNPVNQRGIVSGATVNTAGYFLDNLKLLAGSVVWTQETSLAMASGAKIIGYMEENYRSLLGKTATFGLETPGSLYPTEITGAFPGAVAGATIENAYVIDGVGTVRFGFEYRSGGVTLCGASQTYVPYVSFEAAAALTILRMKPELGKVSTLMKAPPPDYGLTLRACKRMFQRITSAGGLPNGIIASGLFTNTANRAIVLLPMNVPMRIAPSLTLTAGGYLYGNGIYPQVTAIAVDGMNADSLRLLCTVTFDIANQFRACVLAGGAAFDLDAGL